MQRCVVIVQPAIGWHDPEAAACKHRVTRVCREMCDRRLKLRWIDNDGPNRAREIERDRDFSPNAQFDDVEDQIVKSQLLWRQRLTPRRPVAVASILDRAVR
jgi:hypothetical protein